ncbi:MAG: glycosyltransferase family 25 protein [Nocardioides sp.]
MRTYVVNLARSQERRAHMLRELRRVKLDYEFIEAADGRDLDLSDADLVDPGFVRKGAFWAGVVGCSLSHLWIYAEVLKDDADLALILEDDVVLPIDITALVDAVAVNLVGAEAVLLHHHRRGRAERGESYRFLRGSSVSLPGSRTLAAPADVGDLAGTGAYLITREACARMLKEMLPVRARADDWEFFCERGALDNVRCVIPMPVRADTRFRTTIDHYGARSLQTRVRDAVQRIPVLSQALARRRQRLLARRTQVELIDDA